MRKSIIIITREKVDEKEFKYNFFFYNNKKRDKKYNDNNNQMEGVLIFGGHIFWRENCKKHPLIKNHVYN